jgi:hypothetical protein
MPIGAMKVARCFSAASMKIVKTSSAVKNISMKRPRATFVSADNVVATANFCQDMHVLVNLLANDGNGEESHTSGNSAATTPALAMAPMICAMKTTARRV